MNREKKLVPKLRFPGFEGEWVEKRLGEVIEISSASRVHKHEWTESGVPFFRSSDVVANYKGTENTKAFISMDLFKKLSEKSGRVSKDDILLTGGGSIGIPYLINSDEPLYFKDADLLWLKTASIIDGQFLYAFFITLVFRKYINSISHIGTISHYTIEQAKETPICLPQKEEQQKIGTFFKQLDDSIALQQRKLSHLQAQKKGLLQKMFPKAGQALPELRFPGFEGKWEERKLGEITSKIGSGKTPRGGKSAYQNDGICLIRSQNVNFDSVNLNDVVYIDDETDEEMKNSRVKDGDVLLNITGASIGRSAVFKGNTKANVNQHVCIIRPVDNRYSSEFIQLNIISNNGQNQIDSFQAGGAREGLNFHQIQKMTFSFPQSDEQNKIGEYFSNIDNLITLHQRKLEHLQTRKKALLQQMFV